MQTNNPFPFYFPLAFNFWLYNQNTNFPSEWHLKEKEKEKKEEKKTSTTYLLFLPVSYFVLHLIFSRSHKDRYVSAGKYTSYPRKSVMQVIENQNLFAKSALSSLSDSCVCKTRKLHCKTKKTNKAKAKQTTKNTWRKDFLSAIY